MAYKELLGLIDHLDQSTVAYVDYQTDSQHLILSKKVPQLNMESKSIKSDETPQPPKQKFDLESENTDGMDSVEETDRPEEKAGEAVKSPMVGVAYLQGNPDEKPYVKVGDQIEQGDIICVIEAMKLMNEIQAPHSGTVTEILIGNEEVVEFNQGLIRIKE